MLQKLLMRHVNLTLYGNTPISYSELLPQLGGYSAPKNKVQDMLKKGDLIPLKKGYYVIPQSVSGQPVVPELVANHLHGPSYVSLSTALRYYGLIPERVVAINSVTSARRIQYSNPTGIYYYTHVPSDYFSLGVTIGTIEDTFFLIATPEKAICDLIVTTRNLRLRSLIELRRFLEEDLRLDMDRFYRMDPTIFLECAQVSQKKETILNLAKILNYDTVRQNAGALSKG